LDDGSIGDGIGKRNTEFDEIDSAAFEGSDQASGCGRRRIAGRDVADETGAALLTQTLK
jgi:hypothetical protein